MKKTVFIISILLCVSTTSVMAQEMTQKEKINYALGVFLGEKINEEVQKSGIDLSIFETIKEKVKEVIDLEFIKAGFSDIFKGECKLSKEEIGAALAELEKEKEFLENLLGGNQNNENQYDDYNAACVLALSNEIDSAFEQLFIIANNGNFPNLEHILTDSDLNSLHQDKRWNELIEMIRAKVYVPLLAMNYGNLSWYYLCIKEFTQSEQAARQALQLDASQTWVKVNLANALLFQNRFSETEIIYRELMQNEENENLIKDLWDDLEKLEKEGVIPENQKDNVEIVRKMLQE